MEFSQVLVILLLGISIDDFQHFLFHGRKLLLQYNKEDYEWYILHEIVPSKLIA